MKSLIQTWFSKHDPKALDKAFKAKDCCVDRVLSADQALESALIASQVLKGKIARKKMTPIIKLLQQEAKMRSDVLI
jgi:crotonobetainyl-CoA:carnitine CoA-transferase CaiB-like acyl-CoA transferase